MMNIKMKIGFVAMAVGIISAGTGVAAPYVDSTNTVLLLHMDVINIGATTTTPDDDSAWPIARDHDGTLLNGPMLTNSVDAAHANAIYLDGVDDRITVADSIAGWPTSGVRYECWAKSDMAKANDDSDHYLFLHKGSAGIDFRDRSGGDWRIDFNAWDGTMKQVATTDGSLGIDVTQWNHYALEVKDGTLTAYVNGSPVGSTPCGDIIAPSSNLDIGSTYVPSQFWGGMVDEFRVTAAEIPLPPLSPYTDDGNTMVLYHMDGVLDDDSANPGRDRDMYTGVTVPTFSSVGGVAGFGDYAVFDGSSSRVHVKDSVALPSDNIRYEFWMKEGVKKDNDSWSLVMLDAWSILLEVQDRSNLDYRFDFDVWDSAGTKFEVVGTDGGWGFDASSWNHFSMEVEDGTFSIFINGGLVGSASGLVGGLREATHNIELGMDYNAGNAWDGSLDEFRVYSLYVAATPWEAWIIGYPGVGSQTNKLDNPDGDSLDNLSEWVLGGNPDDDTDIGHVPTTGIVEVGGTNYLEFVYVKRNDADALGLTYWLEQTTDLTGSWASNDYVVGTGTLDGAFDTITNAVPTNVENKQFLKLKFESN